MPKKYGDVLNSEYAGGELVVVGRKLELWPNGVGIVVAVVQVALVSCCVLCLRFQTVFRGRLRVHVGRFQRPRARSRPIEEHDGPADGPTRRARFAAAGEREGRLVFVHIPCREMRRAIAGGVARVTGHP